MILIVFLENAFKHGFDMMDKDAIININLKMDGNNLHFYIENNFTHSENEDQYRNWIRKCEKKVIFNLS